MNLQIVRNVAYSQINKINKNIKEIIEVDKELLNLIDINMKNAINKIIHDYNFKKINGYNCKQERTNMNITDFNTMMTTMTIKDLNSMKDMINNVIKDKVKNSMVVGQKVNIVQKTKKTPGVITKIMQSKCLVKCNITTYRVPMTMLEAQ